MSPWAFVVSLRAPSPHRHHTRLTTQEAPISHQGTNQRFLPSFRLTKAAARPWLQRLLAFGLAGALLTAWLVPDEADARRKRRRHVEPPLRILSITLTPESYVVGNGSLDFKIDVKLPPNLDGSTVLEISSLITSPSKRHLRFLWSRKPIDLHFEEHTGQDRANPDAREPNGTETDGTPAEAENPGEAQPPPTRPDQVSVTLRWDGTDQNKELVSEGRYDYVIRAKLLRLDGEKLRTQMVSWKKKGSIRVKPPPPPESPPADAPEGDGGPHTPQESEASGP